MIPTAKVEGSVFGGAVGVGAAKGSEPEFQRSLALSEPTFSEGNAGMVRGSEPSPFGALGDAWGPGGPSGRKRRGGMDGRFVVPGLDAFAPLDASPPDR